MVITHHHEDHIGGNNILQQNYDVKIYASALTAEIISQPLSIQLYRQMVWGKPSGSRVIPLNDYIETSSGRVLKVISTPGHCDDHICLFEENKRWLFAGDAFLHPRVKVLRTDENFYQIIDSLKEMHQL